MKKSCFQSGGTPVGGSKRSANAFLMHCLHVSRSAGLYGVASSSSSITLSICLRILTIKISEDLYLATKDAETILFAGLRATVLQ